MTSTPYETILQMKKMIGHLDRWIEKAVAHADAKKFDPNVFVTARLAPDMYPFARQVTSACDHAKFPAARLSGKEAPKHPDTEATMAELRERCGKVLAYLDGFTAKDFDGAEAREIALPHYEKGQYALGADYLRESAVPNFYFHLSMAYAILRHNGVDVGKKDFLGQRTLHQK